MTARPVVEDNYGRKCMEESSAFLGGSDRPSKSNGHHQGIREMGRRVRAARMILGLRKNVAAEREVGQGDTESEGRGDLLSGATDSA